MSERMTRSAVMGWNLAFSTGACAASWALVSPRFAGSVAVGALVETWNFRSLWSSSERILGLSGPGVGPAVGAFGLRFVLMALVLWAALRSGAHPVGLVVGLSVIVPAVLLAAWRARPLPVPGASASAPPPDDPSWDAWNPWLAREREADEEEDA